MSATTTDDPRPENPSVEQIADDLSLSNEDGMSWFGYAYDEELDALTVELYDEEMQVLKTYTARITFEEES